MREDLLQILEECCPGVDFENEKALIDDGIIESLDIVMIVSEIKSELDIDITVDDLVPENFNSVDAILELLERRGS